MKQSQFWNAHSHVLFNDRQKYMLHLLLDNSNEKLTTSYWAKINQCSPDTALRDIQDLLSKMLSDEKAKHEQIINEKDAEISKILVKT